MIDVELIWQRDCPNVEAARTNLTRALSRAGLPARWREWCVDDPACPEDRRSFGSPTVLVEGADVAGAAAGGAPCCRVYEAEGGALSGAPSIEAIAAKLRAAGVTTPLP